MIEVPHEMIRYGVHFKDILTCDCFHDEIYFLLRQKVKYEIFMMRFLDGKNCYLDSIYGTIMVVCHDLLYYISQKYSLIGKNCITEIVCRKTNQIELCSICAVDVFRKIDILHIFKLKW